MLLASNSTAAPTPTCTESSLMIIRRILSIVICLEACSTRFVSEVCILLLRHPELCHHVFQVDWVWAHLCLKCPASIGQKLVDGLLVAVVLLPWCLLCQVFYLRLHQVTLS